MWKAALFALSLLLACGTSPRPSSPTAPATADRAVLVQIDGLTPGLLDLYLRSASSRRPGRALARWLVPSAADGSPLSFATGQVHTAVLPLPGLSEPSAGVLLAGRPAADLGLRNPGDVLPEGTPTLLSVLPKAIGVGFPGTDAVEANDPGRIEAALTASAAFGKDGPRFLAVRLSGVADALAAGGLAAGPEALGRADTLLTKLLERFSPNDTLLCVTSGSGAAPGPTQAPVSPGDLRKALNLKEDQLEPTGGLLRLAALPPEGVSAVTGLAATEALLQRTADALVIWDADLGRPRPLLDDELADAAARARLLAWLKPGEWVAVADRRGGHEFRRVGEDPVKIATGGLPAGEAHVPVVFAGAVLPGPGRSFELDLVAPTLLSLLGRDPLALGTTHERVGEARGLADTARRVRHENTVDRGHVVLERDAPAGLEAALGAELPVRRRALSEGAPWAGQALDALAGEARAVVQADAVVVDAGFLQAWGREERLLRIPLAGLDAAGVAARVRSAVALSDGLRALAAGTHPLAAERLRAATDLPGEAAPWQALFLYWAERAAEPATMPAAPALSSAPQHDALAAAFELLTPAESDGETERRAREARLGTSQAPLDQALATLLRSDLAGNTCEPETESRLAARAEAAARAVASTNPGLAARLLERAYHAAWAETAARERLLKTLVDTLEAPGAGWSRVAVSRGVLLADTAGRGLRSEAAHDALNRLARGLLLKLQLDIVSDRAPGYEGRNAGRVASLLDGSGARQPALQAETVALALDGRADLQGRLVAALLASGLNLGSFLSGRGAESVSLLRGLVDQAVRAAPAGDGPEAHLVRGVAAAVAYLAVFLGGELPVPPIEADIALAALDLPALRNEAISKAKDTEDLPLAAYGPFIHLAIKAELIFHALQTGGLPAVGPDLEAFVGQLVKLGRGEARRAGVEERLGPRIDALGAALGAAAGFLSGKNDMAALQAAVRALDLSPPDPSTGLAGRIVAVGALAARDAAYLFDLATRERGSDAALVAGGTALTRHLMTEAAANTDGTLFWRYASLVLHAAQAAVEDAPKWWAQRSPRAVWDKSPAARAALAEAARMLKSGHGEAEVAAALGKDDLGTLVRDQLVFALDELEPLIKAAESGGTGLDNVRDRWIQRLKTRLGQAAQTGQVRTVLTYTILAAQAGAGRPAEVDAALDAAERLVQGTPYAANAWLFPLEAFYARVAAGRPAEGLPTLERAAKLCPARAWHLDLARAWLEPAADPARLPRYVAEARRRGEGGADVSVVIAGSSGHDVYQVNVSHTLVGLLLGRRAGSFQIGAGAQSNPGRNVTLTWVANPVPGPREAAMRAWIVQALNAAMTDDARALDSALGRLLTALHGADPAVYEAAAPGSFARLPPLGPEAPPPRDLLALAWVLTLAEARGHLALTNMLWSIWRTQAERAGWAEVVKGADFATKSLCPTEDEASSPSALACHAPWMVDLKLGEAAQSKALAKLVAAAVGRVMAPAEAPSDPEPFRTALAAASQAAPEVLPPWTRTLWDRRFPPKRPKGKAEPLPPLAEAAYEAEHTKLGRREAHERIQTAGGTCEASLRAAVAGMAAPSIEAVPGACGAGSLYVSLLLNARQGSPAEIVGRTAEGLEALERVAPSQGPAWTQQAVSQATGTLLVADEDIRAATAAASPRLVAAARAMGAPDLALTLRAFAHAWAVAHGATPSETPETLLREARAAGLSGTPAMRYVKRLKFPEAGQDARKLAAEFLAAPMSAQP